MSVIKLKITRYAKRKENMNHNEENNQLTETNPEQVLELANKNIKKLF